MKINNFNEEKSTKNPKMMGFQAEGASPIVRNKVIASPETIATAIRIGNPERCFRNYKIKT